MIKAYEDVRELDKRCYDDFFMSEDILMENAARGVFEYIKSLEDVNSIFIVAGVGNNGGDGIALARMLLGEYKNVYLAVPFGVKSEMAKLQLKRFLAVGGKVENSCKKVDVYVDALFGSGLSRELSKEAQMIIRNLNKQNGIKISIDVPSGLDVKGNPLPVAFYADKTFTMGAMKLSLLSDYAKDFVGDVEVVDLGISHKNYESKTDCFLLEKSDMQLPIRDKQNSHKGSYGHLEVLVGEKSGAGIIASLSALNFGVGLVTAIVKEDINIPYEIMSSNRIGYYGTIAMGMGIGNHFDDELIKISENGDSFIIDADMFYKNEILKFLNKKRVVLTPHPKEFQSLLKLTGFGSYSIEEIQKNRFQFVKEFSRKYPKVVILLKGANKIIGYNGVLYVDNFGTNALAKGGSGDVLSGMIGALLSQNYHPLKATITASIAHSLAGNIKPNYAVTPLKIIDKLEDILKN